MSRTRKPTKHPLSSLVKRLVPFVPWRHSLVKATAAVFIVSLSKSPSFARTAPPSTAMPSIRFRRPCPSLLSPWSSGTAPSSLPTSDARSSSFSLVLWSVLNRIIFGFHGPLTESLLLQSTTFSAIQAGSVFSFVPDISLAKSAASDIIRLLDSTPEIDATSPQGDIPKDVKGRIRFESVHFRYPTRPGVRVLRGLNLTVDPGTYVALVGASGCGKSTMIQLIERFYDPLAGTVYLDEQPITKYNVSEYRKSIALVSQEPTLYAGTVRFNILLGATKPAEEVTQNEIEDACRSANILEFIQSLPDGFDTQVGGKGSQLSGGQKQRIAIARALLRNPKVLLLDEATSALDSNSEKVVQEALDQAAKGRTTIAIAHRLSTIQNADCMYVILPSSSLPIPDTVLPQLLHQGWRC